MAGSQDSQLGRSLREGEAEIIDDWERRARGALRDIAATPRLILRNYLVDYVRRLADAFDRLEAGADVPGSAEGSRGDSAVHGQLRATTPAYDLRHVITEYRILRETVRDYLERRQPLDERQQDLLVHVTDIHITAAAQGFSESLTRLHTTLARRYGRNLVPALGELLSGLEQMRARGHGESAQLERFLGLAERLLQETDALARSVQFGPGEVLHLGFEEGDFREVVRDVLEGARLAYGARFEQRAPPAPLLARYSRAGMERALENLIDNAFQAGHRQSRLRFELVEAGEDVQLSIRGPARAGSAEERRGLAALLEGRHDAAPADEGRWGLGLSLVADTVRAHGGRARVHGQDGDMEVIIRLPREGPPRDESFLLANHTEVPSAPGPSRPGGSA